MIRTLIVSLMATIAVVSAGGCQATKEKTKSTMSFVKGSSELQAERTPEQVMSAARTVAADLELIVIGTSKETDDEGTTTHTFTARTSQDKKVTISAVAEGDKSSRVNVGTGAFGDAELRVQILNRLRTALGVPATQPT